MAGSVSIFISMQRVITQLDTLKPIYKFTWTSQSLIKGFNCTKPA